MSPLPAHDADADTRSRADVLGRDDTAVLVVDVQEAFRPHLPGFDGLVRKVCLLVAGARELDVPVVLTEQYPEGLGATAGEILEVAGDAEILAKLEFSAVRAAGFEDLLRRLGRSQLVVCGLEAHVCVHQTVVDLLGRGLAVHLALDAVGSLDPADREIAVRRALAGGAHATSVEMALFELLGVAGSEEFRAVHGLIKAAGPVHGRRVGGGVR